MNEQRIIIDELFNQVNYISYSAIRTYWVHRNLFVVDPVFNFNPKFMVNKYTNSMHTVTYCDSDTNTKEMQV